MTEFFQSSHGTYHVRSTGLTPMGSDQSEPSVYSNSVVGWRGWRGLARGCRFPAEGRLEFLKRETRRVKCWISAKTGHWYRRFQFWLHTKHLTD